MSWTDYQITLLRPTVTKQESGRLLHYGVPTAHVEWWRALKRLTALLGDTATADRVLRCIFGQEAPDESA